MSFLDNLENNLKSLENSEQKDPETLKREQERRESERNAALLRAPYAEALKKSAFTSDLLTECRAIGRSQRVLVQFTWIGETLRLDARSKRLELVPTPQGIVGISSENGVEAERWTIDFEGSNAATVANRWLNQAGQPG